MWHEEEEEDGIHAATDVDYDSGEEAALGDPGDPNSIWGGELE